MHSGEQPRSAPQWPCYNRRLLVAIIPILLAGPVLTWWLDTGAITSGEWILLCALVIPAFVAPATGLWYALGESKMGYTSAPVRQRLAFITVPLLVSVAILLIAY